jgi:predicted dehydrogenase
MKLHAPLRPAPSPMYHFVDCILNDKPHIATAEEGLRVMEILDALYRSAAEGGPVRIA